MQLDLLNLFSNSATQYGMLRAVGLDMHDLVSLEERRLYTLYMYTYTHFMLVLLRYNVRHDYMYTYVYSGAQSRKEIPS